MLRFTRFEELAAASGPLHLALGVFDGVHLGHRAVIGRALDAARREGGQAGVVTFDPHPIRVLAPEKAPRALLATLDHKAHLLAELGVDLLFAIHFDEAFARMEADTFIDRLCMAPVKTISIGEDWKFGHARRGDVPMLRSFSAERGFRLEAVPPIMADGERISSTRIRQAIRDGNLPAASTMLGKTYSVEGRVIEGRKLGRQLGFPTANVATGDVQLPPDGVWAVRAALGDEKLEGVANLGVRPTVDGVQHALEVHLFDFVGDLYERTLEVTFISHLRGEKKFDSLDELKHQIGLDADSARAILAQTP